MIDQFLSTTHFLKIETNEIKSKIFDLLNSVIYEPKRSIDRKWLFKFGATFILRWSCFNEIPTPLIWQKQISTDFSLPLTVYEALLATCFCFMSYEKKRLLGCCKCILRKKAWFVYFVLYNKSKKWNSKMRGLASPLRPSLIKSPFHPSPSEGRDGRRGIGRGWLINIPFSAISSPFPHISTNAF